MREIGTKLAIRSQPCEVWIVPRPSPLRYARVDLEAATSRCIPAKLRL